MHDTTKTQGTLCWRCARLAHCKNVDKRTSCDNFLESDVTIDELAQTLHINRKTLEKYFVREGQEFVLENVFIRGHKVKVSRGDRNCDIFLKEN